MKLLKLCTLSLGSAIVLAPALLLAQTDPATNPASTTSPSSTTSPNSTSPNSTNQPMAGSNGMNMPQSDSSGSMGANGQMMTDKMFVKKAAAGGLAEVQLAQLALQKSNNPEVKKLAQRMITDHTMLNNKMTPVAASLGIPVPTQLSSMDKAESDKLSALSGPDFDKEYLDYMVKDHHKDLAEFREESRTASDPQLKQTATEGAKVIAEHTKMVDKVASKNGVSVPAGSGMSSM